jgi:CheY-like chemotaxis protein
MLPRFIPVLQLGHEVPPPSFEDFPKKRGLSSGRKKPVVLVIDDERLIADTLAEILTDSGYEVLVAYNGRSAVDQVKEFCPDIVISDVVMPGVNGVEVAKRLARECPDTRVVLLSGQAATSDLLQQAREEGYDFELLVKPLHPNALLKRLSSLGRKE